MTRIALPLAAAMALVLSGCGRSDPPAVVEEGEVPAADTADESLDEIREDETLRFTGNEPFWGGEVTGRTLRYTTPDNPDGETIMVDRFTGLGGIAFSGLFEGAQFEMTVTPLVCSDGMSDRTYPFTVTLLLGEETRNGCGWTERRPFDGPENP